MIPSKDILTEHILDGYALHELILNDEGVAIDYRFLDVNNAFERLTGLSRDIVGRTVLEVIPELDKVWIEKYAEVVSSGESAYFEQYSTALNKYYQVRAYKSADKRFVCHFIDVSERVAARTAAQLSQAQLFAILDNSRDVYLAVDREYRLLTYNIVARDYFKEILGLDLLPELNLLGILPTQIRADWKSRYDRAMAGEDVFISDEFNSGEKQYFAELSVRPLLVGDEIIGATVISRDTTAEVLASIKINQLLEDKELLLREVHHRIKNNIHIIRSMLEIKAIQSSDSACADGLNDASIRLGSMMVLYQKLYAGDDFHSVSSLSYIGSLVAEVLTDHPYPIETELAIDDIQLDSRTASTLGIILNELLANSIKYAFVAERENCLKIVLSLTGRDVEFIYSDNGDSADTKELDPGFGLHLIEAFMQKLKGSHSFDHSDGLTCRMRFTLPE